MKAAQADALICGGIGAGAQNALREAGIRLYGGVSGSAAGAAKALAEGTLRYDAQVQCERRGEGHENEGPCGGEGGCI